MPQTFQVLRCYKCLVFQIHQTKKSNKFACKMCGEKQSIKRHYGIGNGKECRLHVQKLNGIRGEIDEENLNKSIDSESSVECCVEEKKDSKDLQSNSKSKWSEYTDKVEIEESTTATEEAMYLNDAEVVLEIPKKRKSLGSKKFSVKRVKKNENIETACDTFESDEFSQPSNDVQKAESKPVYNYKNVSIQNDNKINSVPTLVKPQNDQIKPYPLSKALREKNNKNHKNIVCNKVNKNSKWAQYADSEEDVLENSLNLDECVFDSITSTQLTDDDIHPAPDEMIENKRESPKVNKNSKWANYVIAKNELENSLNENCDNTETLFSLCDDKDLDSVLNF